MAKIDYERISLLLGVLDGTRQLPKLTPLHNEAMNELQCLCDSIQSEPKKPSGLGGMPTEPSPATETANPVIPREVEQSNPAEEKRVSDEQQKQAELSGRPTEQRQPARIGNEPIEKDSESLLHTDAHGESIARKV